MARGNVAPFSKPAMDLEYLGHPRCLDADGKERTVPVKSAGLSMNRRYANWRRGWESNPPPGTECRGDDFEDRDDHQARITLRLRSYRSKANSSRRAVFLRLRSFVMPTRSFFSVSWKKCCATSSFWRARGEKSVGRALLSPPLKGKAAVRALFERISTLCSADAHGVRLQPDPNAPTLLDNDAG
jgi:hypothetical protein